MTTTIQTMDKLLFLRMLMEGIGWTSTCIIMALCLFTAMETCHRFVREQYDELRQRATRLDYKGEDNGR